MARHATVHASAALGGAVAPRAAARSAGSNVRVAPAASAKTSDPPATTVAPLGTAGWLGSGSSEVPGGSVGALDGDAPAVVGDAGAVVGEGGADDGRAVAVGATLEPLGATTAAVGVAVMRSVSAHAAVIEASITAAKMRTATVRA